MKSKNADDLPAQFRPAAQFRRRPAATGLTLVEVLITMTIFIVLAGFTIMAVKEVVAQWSLGERRRVVYEKGAGVLDMMSDDLRLAMSQEPPGVTEFKVKMIGDFDPETRQQRLMFVRSFEAGPERALTLNAGDGHDNQMLFTPVDDPSKKAMGVAGGGKIDSDDFTGLRVGDFRALGGMAMIGYFIKDQTLYRVIHAPVPQQMSPLLTPGNGQVLASDALYLAFDYWSQNTRSWEAPKKATVGGPERVWDSTRAIAAGALRNFSLHRGKDSADDPDDDVFPEKIRVTVTLDTPMPRCIFGKLLSEMGDSECGTIEVSTTKGFPDGGEEDSVILIDGEWLHYKQKTSDSFVIDARGVRGTKSRAHAENAIIRTGKTFRRVIYIPNWREDLESDEAWHARKDAQRNTPYNRTRNIVR